MYKQGKVFHIMLSSNRQKKLFWDISLHSFSQCMSWKIPPAGCTESQWSFQNHCFTSKKKGGLQEKRQAALLQFLNFPETSNSLGQQLLCTGLLREEREHTLFKFNVQEERILSISALLCHRTPLALSWVQKTRIHKSWYPVEQVLQSRFHVS